MGDLGVSQIAHPARIFHYDPPAEALGWGQRDPTHAMRVELSQNLDGNFPSFAQQRLDGRQVRIEPYIYDTAAHQDDRAKV